MELPVILAILAVVAAIVFFSGVFKSEPKLEKPHTHKKEHTSSSEAAAPRSSAAPAAAAAEKEKKAPKKKNRSNKTKAQKAKARAVASAIAAAASASETENADTEKEAEPSDSDSDSDSSDDEDVPSGVRFQAQAHLEAEKMRMKKAQRLEKERQHHAAKALAKAKQEQPTVHIEETAEATDSDAAPAHFDGWAVVEDKRKKVKKAEDKADDLPSPVTASASAPSPVPVPAEPAQVVPAAPVVETVTQELKVDPRKLGLLIGQKGVTKIAIQTLTGAAINMPRIDKEKEKEKEAAASTEPATIRVTGPALGVSKAVLALTELVNKGYSTLLEGDDFQESYVAVHPKFLPEVIGKGGAVIRALQVHTGIKITVPATLKGPGPDGKVVKVKVGLVGKKEKVSQARALIKDLCKYFHTPVTHPGIVHEEMEMDGKYFNFIIGAKGSEIKNIQNTHKVSVHIPNADSINPNLLIVGAPAGVASAKKHIEKIIDRVDGVADAAAAAAAAAADSSAASAESSAEEGEAEAVPMKGAAAPAPAPAASSTSGGSWAGKSKSRLPPAPKEEEVPAVDETWMKEFDPPSAGMDISAMLPATAKFAATPAPAAVAAAVAPPPNLAGPAPADPAKKAPGAAGSAWNNLSSLPAENW